MDKLSNLLNKKRILDLKEDISRTTNNSSINNLYDNNIFKKNPNFKFMDTIIYDNDSLGFNDIFEIFYSIKDGKSYIVSPNNISFLLNIYSLDNIKLIKSLKRHEHHITMVKYYTNNIKKEYLISADNNGIVIIWDLNDFNDEKYEIKLNIKSYIYSCIMFFDKFDYIITSTCGKEETKLFILNENKIKFIKNIKESKDINVYYLLIWYNKVDENYFLIQFCKNKIVIIDININEIYCNLINENDTEACYINGFIYLPYEYLFSISVNNFINIWDLYGKELVYTIFINDNFLNQIIQWNNKYAIITNGDKNNILIMDLETRRIISKIFSKHEKGIINIKKIIHPIYGESLLSCGIEGSINLWII